MLRLEYGIVVGRLLSWLTLVEHQIIELHYRLFVAFQLLIHYETPSMLV